MFSRNFRSDKPFCLSLQHLQHLASYADLPPHPQEAATRGRPRNPQDGEGVSFQKLCVIVFPVGETPRRADGRFPMFGSLVEVACGIAAATAK